MLTAERVTYLDRARAAYNEALAAEGLPRGEYGGDDSETTARFEEIAVEVATAVTPTDYAGIVQALEDEPEVWDTPVDLVKLDGVDLTTFEVARLAIHERIVRVLTGTE